MIAYVGRIAVAALFMGVFGAVQPAVAQKISVTVVNGHPPVFLWVKHLTETFIPAVERELEGSGITIDWTEAYGGSLAKVGGELEALEEGLAEVGVVPTVFEPAKLALDNVTYYTPFGSTSPNQVVEIIDNLHATVPALGEGWAKNNLVYLGAGFGIDNYHLWTKFPVNSVADLEGRKIGAAGPAVNWLKGTGAVGVSGNLTTYFNSLKTGVYDGVIVFATAALPAKLYEVAPFITKVSFGAQYAGGLAANKDWYDAQPEALQKALLVAAQDYRTAYHKELNARVEGAFATMEAAGATITTLPEAERQKWAALLPNVAKDWASGLTDKGVPGEDVLSAYMTALRDGGVSPARNWDQE